MQPLDSPLSPRTSTTDIKKEILDLKAQIQALMVEYDMTPDSPLSLRISTTDECVGILTMQNDPATDRNIALKLRVDDAKKETLDLKAQIEALMVECDMTPDSPLSPKTSTTDECVGILTTQNDPATDRSVWDYFDDINKLTALIQAL